MTSSSRTRAPSSRVDPLDRRIPDLHRDPADVELDEIRRDDRHRVRPAERILKSVEPVLGRQLVHVEEQVDVRIGVGVAPRAGARQQGAAQGPELERRVNDALGQRTDVLGRLVHLSRIVE
jgi:hypothetical protein